MPDYQGSNAQHEVMTAIWRIPLVDPDHLSLNAHHHGTPAVSRDGKRVLAGSTDGSFHCLDTATGEVIWRKLTRGPVEGEPAIWGDIVYVGSGDGTLYALRLSDGETLWTYQTSGSVDGKPVIVADRVLVMTDINTLHCLNAVTGKWHWSYRRDVPIGRFQVKGVADPIVSEDKVFAGFSDGFLMVLSLKDGSVQKTKKLSGENDRFTDVDTNPLLVRSILYVGSFSQGLMAMDQSTFENRWTYHVTGPSTMEYADGVLYLSTADAKVMALKAETGKPLWTFNTRKGDLSHPTVAGRWLLVSSVEYSLMVLDRATGTLVQLFNPGKGSNAAPAVHGSRVYWVSNGETLYSMETSR